MTLSTDDQLSEIDSHLGIRLDVTGGDEELALPYPMEPAICRRNQRKVDKVQPNEDEIPTVFAQTVGRF